MTGRAVHRAHSRPLPDGPAPFTTLVELTFQKQKIEHWIRFGRKNYEQILDRRRSIVGFAPNSIFAFVLFLLGAFLGLLDLFFDGLRLCELFLPRWHGGTLLSDGPGRNPCHGRQDIA